MKSLTIVLGATLLAGGLAPAVVAQDFDWSARLGDGQAIEIKGINGNVTARGTSSGEVTVTARKSGPDRNDVRIEVVEHDRGVTICAVYPDKNDGRPNECAPGNKGRMNTEDTEAEVEFEVMVPATVRFVGKTVNGDVYASGLTADAVASTVNGDVEVRTGGWVEASTVNGSIKATIGKADWSGDADFTTVNGNIELTVPADLNADIEASTVNGDFESDFPVTIRGRFGPRTVRGTIGDGGRTLELSTVNGSIRLRQS